MRLFAIKPKRSTIIWLLATLAFSAAAFLVRWAGLTIPVLDTDLSIDPREVFVTLGAALTGPVGGLAIGFFAGISGLLSSSNVDGYADLAAHLVAGMLVGWLYLPIFRRWRMPERTWAWAGLVVAYYFVFVAPITIATVLLVDPDWLIGQIGVSLPFWQIYLMLAVTAVPEAAVTLIVTSATLIALPEKYRRPLWRRSYDRPPASPVSQTAIKPGLLTVRLAYWFVLFASLPLVVLFLFVARNMQTAFDQLEAQHQHQLAQVMARHLANAAQPDDAREFLATLAADGLTGFILAGGGEVLASPVEGTDSPLPATDLSAAAREVILARRDGAYVEPPDGPLYAFAPIPGQAGVLVISAHSPAAAGQLFRLERETNLQLLIAVLIMFVGTAVMVWLLIGQPVRKLTQAAGRISGGQLEAQVDPDDMIDDLAVLGTTFNTMGSRINGLIADLEQRVTARTEELSTFFDLNVLAGQSNKLAAVLQQAMPRIQEITHSRTVCIHLLDPAQNSLKLVARQELPDEFHAGLQSLPASPEVWPWLQQPDDPLVTTHLAGFNRVPAAVRLAGYRAYIGAQIRSEGQVQGVLSCYRRSPHEAGLDEISLVTALAQQLGLVLATFQLRRTIQEVTILEERQRLARDLHDSVTQSLFGLSLLGGNCREAAEAGDTGQLLHSATLLEQNALHTLWEMRRLLYELRPADLAEEGLVNSIRLRLNTVEQRVGLKLEAQIDELPDLLPTYEVELYHIIMEALNNMMKHAAASQLTLRLTRDREHLHLLIADNGRGFDPAQTTGGLGLSNIRERVRRLRGQVSITSRPGGGTRLEVHIPYPPEGDQ